MIATAALLLLPSPAPRPTDAGVLHAVPAERVELRDPFWSPRLATLARATLPAILARCVETGRVANFARAAGREEGAHQGHRYDDSDVYKLVEALARVLARAPDAALAARLDELVELIAAAQQEDGYLNTYVQLGGAERWADVRHGHELYCAGHLIEAALAHRAATGEDALLDVSRRLAARIDEDFGPDARRAPPGHQELELALYRLADATGEERWAALATFFLEQRGRAGEAGRESWGEYAQDHAPIRAQTEAVGHAVRATYQYAATADLYRRTGDGALLAALESLWRDVVGRKMYLTGGVGSSARNEGFTEPFDLPNDGSYAETCASVGMVLWNWRMLLATGETRFADLVERELYNGVLAGVSLDGERFSYRNPLASRGADERSAWFSTACCPPNLARCLASVPGWLYASDGADLRVALYAGSRVRVELDGTPVELAQTTRYPWDGSLLFVVRPERPLAFPLRLRVPVWHEAPLEVRVNDEPPRRIEGDSADPLRGRGWATIERTWQPGDRVRVDLHLPPRSVLPDPRVAACAGRAALMRGPVVYCLEGADHGGAVRAALADPAAALEVAWRDELGGFPALRTEGRRLEQQGRLLATRPVELTAIPYALWGNRGPNEMVVWIPIDGTAVELPGEGARLQHGELVLRASHCGRDDSLAALVDGLLPASPGDDSIPRATFWPRRGAPEAGPEWLQRDAPEPVRAGEVVVHWFDDATRGGGCRLPSAWRLLYLDEGIWRSTVPLEGQSFEVGADGVDAVRFAPAEARSWRLEVDLREDASAGVLEWVLR